jgi:hypothetical protein
MSGSTHSSRTGRCSRKRAGRSAQLARALVERLGKETTFPELERWSKWLAKEEKAYKPSELTRQAARASAAEKRKKSFPAIDEPESVLLLQLEAAAKKGDRDELGEKAYELVLWDMKRELAEIMEEKAMFGDPDGDAAEVLRGLPEKYAARWEEIYRKGAKVEVNERRAAVKQRFEEALPPSARKLPGALIQRPVRTKLDLSPELAGLAEFVVELPADLEKRYGARRMRLQWFQPNLTFLNDMVRHGKAECAPKPEFVLVHEGQQRRLAFGRFDKLARSVETKSDACASINDVLDRQRVGRHAEFVFVRNVPAEYRREIPGYSLEEAEETLARKAMTPVDRKNQTEAARMISIRRGGWSYPTMALVRAVVDGPSQVEFGKETVRESGGALSYSIEPVAAGPVVAEIRERAKEEEKKAIAEMRAYAESGSENTYGVARRECEKCGSASGVFRTHGFSGNRVVPVHICAKCADHFVP